MKKHHQEKKIICCFCGKKLLKDWAWKKEETGACMTCENKIFNEKMDNLRRSSGDEW